MQLVWIHSELFFVAIEAHWLSSAWVACMCPFIFQRLCHGLHCSCGHPGHGVHHGGHHNAASPSLCRSEHTV